MVPVCGASVAGLTAKIFPLWKSNKKVLQCQRISGPARRSVSAKTVARLAIIRELM
jgi:hypothetical protein